MTTSLRPSWFVRKVANPAIAGLGMATTLAVTGRSSGVERTVPVNVLEHDGKRYLLSPRGETDWVKNLRATGGGELRRRGTTERFTASEIDVAERPELIAAYRENWDSQVRKLFEQLPEPGDHPTFLIEAVDD
ncbi:MAG: nitroreductase family deazaflavin-dependent oxidoreductase [Acidimicrobiales bacterium]